MDSTIIQKTDEIRKMVYQHLSTIGKRLKDNAGNTKFSLATLSGAENVEFLQYVKSSAAHVTAEIPDLLVKFNVDDDDVEIFVSKPRWKDATSEAFGKSVVAAIVACTTYEIISAYAPDYSKKYAEDANTCLQDMIRHAYMVTKPPMSGRKIEECKGSVEF